ncbi:MAG: GNAT family N-acetyltransferase [Candidatus Diapherotrites archaeon]
MAQNLEISKAKIEDVDGISKLFPHWGYELTKKRVIRSFFSENEIRFVAKIDNEIVGHILVRYNYIGDMKVAKLQSLIVASQHRNKGIGTEVVKYALSNLKHNTKKVISQVSEKNAASLRIFKKLGFKVFCGATNQFKEKSCDEKFVTVVKDIK